MSKDLYNEGRVVGYSQYELYVKQALASGVSDATSDNGGVTVASEQEWLASSLASGASMILRMPNVKSTIDDGYSVVDIQLPQNSRLYAANTILAQFFYGEVETSSSVVKVKNAYKDDSSEASTLNHVWANNVTDYGQGVITNNSSNGPIGEVSWSDNYGYKYHTDVSHSYTGALVNNDSFNICSWDDNHIAQLKEYMQIVDGGIVHSGKFTKLTKTSPKSDLSPDITGGENKEEILRIVFRGTITHHPLILLTGFTIGSVLAGVAGLDGSVDTDAPEDGDFLGPSIIPWATKVTWVVPNSYINYFMARSYRRKITPDDPKFITVGDTSVIDQKSKSGKAGTTTYQFDAPVAENYYANATETDAKFYWANGTPLTQKQASRVSNTVDGFATLGDGTSVLTVYQKSSIYPPALYSTFVTKKGQNYLHPLDSVAPGTIKMFANGTEDDLKNYQETFSGTTAMNKTSDGRIQILDQNNKIMDIAKIEFVKAKNSGENYNYPDESGTTSAAKDESRPDLVKLTIGKKSVYLLPLSSTIDESPIQSNLANKLNALQLTSANSNDNISWTSLVYALFKGRSVDILNTRLKSAKSTLIANEGYLEFGPENDKLRLYISDTAPSTAGVPVGSIGIGWGFNTSEG